MSIKKNIFSIIVALIIMYLSLASANTFDKVPEFDIPYIDKIVHFLMYFGLTSVMILEHHETVKKFSSLLLLGLFPFFYGILMEILQSNLTSDRTGDIFDAVSNTSGIIVSILIWLSVRPLFYRIFKK
jgi:VanZ family protein